MTDPEQLPLAGSLLIAHPAISDPHFRRSVVFIASHDSGGTFGFILNKPSGKKLADFLDEPGVIGALGNVPVHVGGPVGTNQIIISVFKESEDPGGIQCSHGLSVEDVQQLSQSGEARVRAFVGHSGWEEGQLAHELDRKSWFVHEAPREILDTGEDAWRILLGGMGPWHRLQAEAPDDPGWN